ncbi:TBC1 domain family member 2B [Elysia marginata]|uniref:TBC1 domain family member 2B n=1 Tax=Elysia marginata TaxID=1093978 RepID=A0AAV4JBI9_9GAST|nr:TBC1 domain family member 2B [Elysia marginata]
MSIIHIVHVIASVKSYTIASLFTHPLHCAPPGIKYRDDCPLEPRIPIYLLVGGSFGALKISITLWKSIRRRQQESVDNIYGMSGGLTSHTYRSMDIILSLFLLAWHVLGTVWVLSIWKPRFKPLLHRPTQYCDRSLYFFSVSVIAGVYAVLALLLLGIGCLTCIYRSNGGHRGHG